MVIVQSNYNFFSFSKNRKGNVDAFCTTDLTEYMLLEIKLSGIVGRMSCVGGRLVYSPKIGYDVFKMGEVVIGVFEKFGL
jgi:hypothetical protein